MSVRLLQSLLPCQSAAHFKNIYVSNLNVVFNCKQTQFEMTSTNMYLKKKTKNTDQKFLHMNNESSGCRLNTESSLCVACCHHSTCGRWYRSYLRWKKKKNHTIMSTTPGHNIWLHIYKSYLYCEEGCSQGTGLHHGSRPSPSSFQESLHSFYTGCMSCTPTNSAKTPQATFIVSYKRG